MIKMPGATDFVLMIEQFLRKEISVEDFCERFTERWMQRRDALYEFGQNTLRGQDHILLQKLQSAEISKENFASEWTALWGNKSDPCLDNMVDNVHSACSIYSPEPEFEWEINEAKLRDEIRNLFSDFLRCCENQPVNA